MQQPTAPVIRLRRDRFEQRAKVLGLANDSDCARYIGVHRSTLSRVLNDKIAPDKRFIAACLSSGFAGSFEYLFELGEAS